MKMFRYISTPLIILALSLFPNLWVLGGAKTSAPIKQDLPSAKAAKHGTLVGQFEELSADEMGLEILGVIVNKQRVDENVILLKDLNTKQTFARRVGWTVVLEEKFTITSIAKEYFELSGSKKLRLYKVGFLPVRAVKKPEPIVAAPIVLGSYRENGFERDNDSITMTEEYRKNLITKELPKILMQAAAEPEVDPTGNIVGFRLWDIESGSMYQKAGIQDGDLISTINGEPLNDVKTTIDVLNSLKTAQGLQFEIIRNGQRIPLNIQVK